MPCSGHCRQRSRLLLRAAHGLHTASSITKISWLLTCNFSSHLCFKSNTTFKHTYIHILRHLHSSTASDVEWIPHLRPAISQLKMKINSFNILGDNPLFLRILREATWMKLHSSHSGQSSANLPPFFCDVFQTTDYMPWLQQNRWHRSSHHCLTPET